MADEVKPQKPEFSKPKDAPAAPAGGDPFAEIVGYIIVLLLAVYALNGVYSSIRESKLFSLGWGNLSPEGILISHTVPVSSRENPINHTVVSKNETNVYDSPNGKNIGKQKIGARGKIIQGPVSENGERYWYVDYESGDDGWVKENDIGILLEEPTAFEKFVIYILVSVGFLKVLIIAFSLLATVASAYIILKLTKLRVAEREALYPKHSTPLADINPQWLKISNHIESTNENDWRLAILEADIMLGGLLDTLFLPGETIGDKLKAVEKSDFLTIDNAWEAHKVRNQIAHDGSAFMLSQREAKRVIGMYQSIFEEFQII